MFLENVRFISSLTDKAAGGSGRQQIARTFFHYALRRD
jgi:hypothetical protein